MANESEPKIDVSRETCSKCEKDLDTTGFPKWCKKCRKSYNDEYKSLQKQMSETRGFAAGVSAAKHFIANEFDCSIRGATINGHEAARLVRACKGPALPVT